MWARVQNKQSYVLYERPHLVLEYKLSFVCHSSDEKWQFEEKDNTEKNLAYIKALRSLQAVDRETAEKVNAGFSTLQYST